MEPVFFMVRIAFLLAICIGTTADAAPIRVTQVSATFWSESDEVEFRIWFDRPPVFPGDWLYFTGTLPADLEPWPPTETFTFGNYLQTPGDTDRFPITHTTDPYDVVMSHTEFRGDAPYQLDGRLFTAIIPFSLLGIADRVRVRRECSQCWISKRRSSRESDLWQVAHRRGNHLHSRTSRIRIGCDLIVCVYRSSSSRNQVKVCIEKPVLARMMARSNNNLCRP